MLTKCIEIRDECTCIAAVAIKMIANTPPEASFLKRCGYPDDGSSITLMLLTDQRATNDPYCWVDLRMGSRTVPHVHAWILNNWDKIIDGQVVDARVVLEETLVAAEPEIHVW